ncbi:hypothetical protein [Candidatus Nitrosocosmicus sp. T]
MSFDAWGHGAMLNRITILNNHMTDQFIIDLIDVTTDLYDFV